MVVEKGEGRGGSKVNKNKTSMWQDVWGVNGAQGMQQWSGKDFAKGKEYAVQSLYASAVSDGVVMPASGAALKFSPPR